MNSCDFNGSMKQKTYDGDEILKLLQYSKDVICDMAKNKDDDPALLEYQYLTLAGMLYYYDRSYHDSILDTFQRLPFYFSDSLPNYVDENGTLGGFVEYSFHYPVLDWSFPILRKLFSPSVESAVYFNTGMNNNPYLMFMIFVHEVNHSINSSQVNLPFHHYMRSGISFYDIDYNQEGLGLFLEEAFNSLQTEEIMDNVLFFGRHFPMDSNYSELYQKIFESWYDYQFYSRLTSLVSPMYFHPDFYSVLNQGRLSGDIESVSDHFDEVVGEDSWKELCSSVDDFWKKHSDGQKAKQLVHRYVSH